MFAARMLRAGARPRQAVRAVAGSLSD